MTRGHRLARRRDVAVPHRQLAVWFLAVGLVGIAARATAVIVTGAASGTNTATCRLHEAREGIPILQKMDVSAVGQQPEPGWVPPRNVHVRYVRSGDARQGLPWTRRCVPSLLVNSW
jgi:hypothetical protein